MGPKSPALLPILEDLFSLTSGSRPQPAKVRDGHHRPSVFGKTLEPNVTAKTLQEIAQPHAAEKSTGPTSNAVSLSLSFWPSPWRATDRSSLTPKWRRIHCRRMDKPFATREDLSANPRHPRWISPADTPGTPSKYSYRSSEFLSRSGYSSRMYLRCGRAVTLPHPSSHGIVLILTLNLLVNPHQTNARENSGSFFVDIHPASFSVTKAASYRDIPASTRHLFRVSSLNACGVTPRFIVSILKRHRTGLRSVKSLETREGLRRPESR